jgi:hypothetical protein
MDEVPRDETKLDPTEATAVSKAPKTAEGRFAETPPDPPEQLAEIRPRTSTTRFFILLF